MKSTSTGSRPAAVPTLVTMRTTIGAGALSTPRFAGRLFGLDPDRNPQAPYLGRLFGVRELALAAGTLSTEGEARRRWLQLGVICDLAEAAAALLARRRGYVGPFTTVLLTAPAVAAAALGVLALQHPPDQRRRGAKLEIERGRARHDRASTRQPMVVQCSSAIRVCDCPGRWQRVPAYTTTTRLRGCSGV